MIFVLYGEIPLLAISPAARARAPSRARLRAPARAAAPTPDVRTRPARLDS